ncbi:MAG TPA: M20 family metallopeptidase [Longimicrobiales bacterium]|nr:M20 family metallopeptidase [Longimicrobiales bacterium]
MATTEADRPTVLDRVRRFVEMESPSGDVARAGALAEVVAAELSAAGAEVCFIDAPGWGYHVQATVPGTDEDAEPVFILGHLDTVWPVGTLAARPFRLVDGRAEGPGIFDMKSGLAVAIEALAELRHAGARPARPVRVLVTCDEEVGSTTSRPLIETLARDAVATLVLEPSLPGGAAKTSRKGVGVYRLRFTGRAAHAGVDPEKGVSAVLEMAHQTLALHALAAPARGTTVSVGPVHGGTVSNVIPAEAEAEVDVRFSTLDEGERVDAAIRALRPVLPGAGVAVVQGGINRPPLERTDAVVALYRTARNIAHELGFDLPEGSTGGGSDGCFTAALGIPTLDGLGPQGAGAHAIDEHIVVADLPRRVALVRRLLEAL